MAQEIINYGAAANDGTGDPLRTAFIKTDNNFDQIWAAGPVGSNVTIINNTVSVTNTNGNLILMPNGIGVIQTNSRVVPSLNNTYDLGAANSTYRSAYIGTGGLNVAGNVSVAGNLSAANVVFSGPVAFPSDVVIDGNLTVNGDTVTVNVSNLAIEDKTIILANGSPNAASANGAGIIVDGANAQFIYNSSSNAWTTNTGLDVNGLETTDGLAVVTNGFSWFMGGNILTTPNGGSWYADTTNNDEYISSAFDGFISMSALYASGNIGSELDLLHGTAIINVHDFDNNAYGWQFGEFSPAGVVPDLFTPGNIIPKVSNAYSLGNVTNQWSDLWVSNATIYMNSVPVTLAAGNVLTVGGQPLLSNDSNTSISTTGTITADEFFGNISAANVVGLATVATSGSYNDLDNTPVIPTATSNLTNDSGFITANVIGNFAVTGNITGNTAGFAIGYRDIPQVSFTGNATIATSDAGKHFYSTQSSNYTLTIANNASQGLQVGAAITVVNQGTGTITVAQGPGVTLYMAGNATSGNRTISTFGMATLIKVATDTWFINGTGVS